MNSAILINPPMVDEQCFVNVDVDIDWVITCPACSEKSEVEVRCRILIALTDSTATLTTTISGQDAKKFIPYTAIELKQAEKDEIDLEKELADSINLNAMICFIRAYDMEYQSQKQRRFSIVKAYTPEERAYDDATPKKSSGSLTPTKKRLIFAPNAEDTSTTSLLVGCDYRKIGARGCNVGEDGGFASNISGFRDALDLVKEAISRTEYNQRIKIALDVAASTICDLDYKFSNKSGQNFKFAEDMIEFYKELCNSVQVDHADSILLIELTKGWLCWVEMVQRA
ncbi:Enolase, C-terminal TIM barrel domain [Dillenia turbinata]|uniref:phosphopyruvate hydratase n=1 Tax=Dillenia turbinata TaxID=194707 RepID=A0AAN8UTP6_9MAGN